MIIKKATIPYFQTFLRIIRHIIQFFFLTSFPLNCFPPFGNPVLHLNHKTTLTKKKSCKDSGNCIFNIVGYNGQTHLPLGIIYSWLKTFS